MIEDFEMVVPPSVSVESDNAVTEVEVIDEDQRLISELLGDPYDQVAENPPESADNNGGVIAENPNEIPGTQIEIQPLEGTTQEEIQTAAEEVVFSTENHLEMLQYEQLDELLASVESDGLINLDIAKEIDRLSNGYLFKNVNPNGFTQLPSKNNLAASMESMNMLKYGAMAVGAIGLGYIALRVLRNNADVAKAASTKFDIDRINSKNDLRTKDLTEYEKRIKRLAGHIDSGVLRNKKLLENIQANATRRFRDFDVKAEGDPFKFGQVLVEEIFQYKIEKSWCRGYVLTVTNANLSNTVEKLTTAYKLAASELLDKFKKFKADVRSPDLLQLKDYQIDWSNFDVVNASLEGTHNGTNNPTIRESGIATAHKLDSLFNAEAGLKKFKLKECLNIYVNSSSMNSLDATTYTYAMTVHVIFSDLQKFIKEYFKDEILANRTEILEEMEKDVRTLSNNYKALIRYRGKISSLVGIVRSSIKEANGMWDNIDRDQSGRI